MAEELENGLKYTQLRKFFTKLRYIETQLKSGIPFEAVRADIASLEAAAVAAVTRNVAPPVFRVFMEKNMKLALVSKESFLGGLVPHFQSVVCYFRRTK